MFTTKYKQILYFLLYLLFFFALAAIYHSDVLVNSYNYGRHWDWSFYALSDLYSNYLSSAALSFKSNSLGYFDVFSINLAEFFLKLTIYSIFHLFQALNIQSITIPIINKVAVFIIIPMFTTLGIWHLARRILTTTYKTNPFLFLLITIFCNLLYTFSLILILDLHGGALNRQISSAFYPWFFSALINYFNNTKIRFLDIRVVLLVTICATFDISNIFFSCSLVVAAMFFKKAPWKYKFFHLFLFSSLLLLINTYWLHVMLFPQGSAFTKQIITSRKPNDAILASYSTNYFDMFLFLNSPHNLINRTFGKNILIYIPYIFLYMLLLYNLFNLRNRQGQARMLLLLISGYILINTLTAGIFAFGPLYKILVQFEFLGFIRGAIRYMPNLLIYTIFFFLLSLQFRYKITKEHTTREYFYFIIPISIWLCFLLTNANIMSSILSRVVKNEPINHDIGALYEYNPYPSSVLRKERLVYNVLPIPSWFSPIFIDNVYPKTSQGSDTDNHFLNKGILFTYGSVIPAAQLFEGFIRSAAVPQFYSITNTKYIWFKNITIFSNQVEQSFTYQWVRQSLADYRQQAHLAFKTASLLEIPSTYIVHHIYIPNKITISNKSLRHFPELIQELPEPASALFMVRQNKTKVTPNEEYENNRPPTLEFKKINSTKYRVKIHAARSEFPLIMSNNYNDGWKAYVTKIQYSNPKIQNLDSYKILDGNERDQATSEELKEYVKNGWISTLGDFKEKQFQHVKFQEGKELPDYIESYKIDFISKNRYGSIQNDNLPTGSLLESINSPHIKLNDLYHLKANGFANSWIIQPENLCKNAIYCIHNKDGSYDIELLLEFEPQQAYYKALLISSITLGGCLVLVILNRFLRSKEQ